MITLTPTNFDRFRHLLTAPNIRTLKMKPASGMLQPCKCSRRHGVTLIGTMILGEQASVPTKDLHICNKCHEVFKDNGQKPVYGTLDTYLAEVVKKHGTVHLFLNDKAKGSGFLITAMQAIHEAVNATTMQEIS